MFEAFSRFPGSAQQCLKYLARQGYGAFDIFVRVGQELTGIERFRRPELPKAWGERQGTLFYANVIAYHPAAADRTALPDPVEFFDRYRQTKASKERAAA
jgi:hypothetical protein